MINLEETKDEELDAILGELSILESQFQEEITAESTTSSNSMQSKTNIKQPSPVASVTSSTGSRSSPSSETAKKPASNNGKRTESPDTDSAFCDNLSVLSSCSTSSRFVLSPDKTPIKLLLRNYQTSFFVIAGPMVFNQVVASLRPHRHQRSKRPN